MYQALYHIAIGFKFSHVNSQLISVTVAVFFRHRHQSCFVGLVGKWFCLK